MRLKLPQSMVPTSGENMCQSMEESERVRETDDRHIEAREGQTQVYQEATPTITNHSCGDSINPLIHPSGPNLLHLSTWLQWVLDLQHKNFEGQIAEGIQVTNSGETVSTLVPRIW